MFGNNSDTQQAYRHFWNQAPLQVGQTFQIDYEAGQVQGGGDVGFILQSPAGPTDRLEVLFNGGSPNFFLNNSTNSLGINTGIPFTNSGLHCTFTLTSPDTMNVTLTGLNGNANSFTTNGVVLKGVPGTGITQVRLYNFNAGATGAGGFANIAFFNNLVEGARADDCAAFDCASNYTALSWTNLSNGGTGFNQWSFQPANTNAFSKVTYALGDSTTPVLFDGSRGINSQTTTQAFGMTASPGSIAGGVTNTAATAQIYRPFSQGGMTEGQSFTLDFQNGYVFGGSNYITSIVGTTTNSYFIPGGAAGFKLEDGTANSRMELFFAGGSANYQMNIGSYNNSLLVPAFTNYTIGIPVSFTDRGLRCTFTFMPTNGPSGGDTMNVSIAGLNSFTGFNNTNVTTSFVTNGLPLIGTTGDAVTQVFLYDFGAGADLTTNTVWFNNFALSGNCESVVPNQITSIKVVNPNVLVTIPTVAGQSYQLQTLTPPNLSQGGGIVTNSNWGNVIGSGGTAVGTGSSLTLTNVGGAVGATQGFYRVIIN